MSFALYASSSSKIRPTSQLSYQLEINFPPISPLSARFVELIHHRCFRRTNDKVRSLGTARSRPHHPWMLLPLLIACPPAHIQVHLRELLRCESICQRLHVAHRIV